MMSTWDHEYLEIDSHQAPTDFQEDIFTLNLCKYEVLTTKNPENLQQLEERYHSIIDNRTCNPCVDKQLGGTTMILVCCDVVLHG